MSSALVIGSTRAASSSVRVSAAAALRRLHFGAHCFGVLSVAASLVPSAPAFAQRASDNAVAAAQDAFGTVVGNETIGLYSAGSARGFSPSTAGNNRLEGLYIDRQGNNFSNRLVRGSSIRVGISAQSYPFAAPTGIADYNLRVPGEDAIYSVVGKYGPYGGYSGEFDAQVPLIPGTLSIGGGVSAGTVIGRGSEGDYPVRAGALIARWKVTDNIEVIPFISRDDEIDRETKPRLFLTGPYYDLPIDRKVFWNQDWADSTRKTTNFGVINRGNWDDWRVQLGAFRSYNNRSEFTLGLFRNAQANGIAQSSYNSFPQTISASTSGELRVSRGFIEGDWRHTFHASARGRSVNRDFGGVAVVAGGPVQIGVPNPIPKPAFNYAPLSLDSVRELNAGLSYTGIWKDVGEMSVGLQRSSYERTLRNPATPTAATKSSPWLYNATMTGYLTSKAALYGSYTRGLEDGATAPDRAINPGQTAPAAITEQIDFGARYAVTSNFRLIAGVFRVTKPQYDLDASDFFRQIGKITHDGVEFSASGEVVPGLRVVGGVVLLRARLSGVLVDQGLVGAVPPDVDPRTVKLNIQYAPPAWPAWSFDGQINNIADKFTDATNTFKVPSQTTLDLGGRYRFDIYGNAATLRAQVTNVTNEDKWELGFGRSQYPMLPRTWTLQLAVDF